MAPDQARAKTLVHSSLSDYLLGNRRSRARPRKSSTSRRFCRNRAFAYYCSASGTTSQSGRKCAQASATGPWTPPRRIGRTSAHSSPRNNKHIRKWYLTAARAGFYMLDIVRLHRLLASHEINNYDVVIFDRYIYDQIANIYSRSWLRSHLRQDSVGADTGSRPRLRPRRVACRSFREEAGISSRICVSESPEFSTPPGTCSPTHRHLARQAGGCEK